MELVDLRVSVVRFPVLVSVIIVNHKQVLGFGCGFGSFYKAA